MKRLTLLFVVMLAFSFMSNIHAQRAIKKGTSLNLVIGFPSDTYGMEEDDVSNTNLGTIWGIQYGNRWYIAPTEKFGVAVMVNWIDFTFGLKSGTETIDLGVGPTVQTEWARAVLDISLIELGPLATFAINDDMAIDGYYNLRPTIISSALVRTTVSVSGDDTYGYAGFGFSHAIGAAFRWKVLNIGLEYVTGGINSSGAYTGPQGDGDLPDAKLRVNNVRLMLGVKF